MVELPALARLRQHKRDEGTAILRERSGEKQKKSDAKKFSLKNAEAHEKAKSNYDSSMGRQGCKNTVLGLMATRQGVSEQLALNLGSRASQIQ